LLILALTFVINLSVFKEFLMLVLQIKAPTLCKLAHL